MMSYSSTGGGETSEVRRAQPRTLRKRRTTTKRRMRIVTAWRRVLV